MVHGTQGGPAAREAEIKAPANKVETHLKPILREGSIQSQLLGGGGGARPRPTLRRIAPVVQALLLLPWNS